MDLIHYVAMGVGMAVAVGPFNIELINRGIKGGISPALSLAFGGIAAYISFLILIYFGLSQSMQNQLIEILSYTAGALILLLLGCISLTSGFGNPKASPSNQSSFVTGFFLVFASPINFMTWYSTFSQASNTLFVENSLFAILGYCFFVIAGCFLWMINLILTVYFIRERISARYTKMVTLITGIMLLWFCSEYFRRLAEITLNW